MNYWSLRRRRSGTCEEPAAAKRVRHQANPEGVEPDLEQVLDIDYLLDVFDRLRREGGQAEGADGIGYDRLGRTELAAVLREKCEAIRLCRWRPDPVRVKRIPKRSGGHRELQLPTIPDRVLYTGLNDWISPFCERVFATRSHGFRPNRSHLGLLAALDAEIRATRKTVLVVDDVRTAYDSVNIAHCMTAHRQHLRGESLLAYITTALRGHNLRRTIGIGQGNAYSPIALNVLLHEAHDRHLNNNENGQNLSWYRYADNLAYLVQDTTVGQAIRQRTTTLLQTIDMTLKDQGSQMADLRDQPIELLGLTIRMRDATMVYSIPESSWESGPCPIRGDAECDS